MVYYSKSFTIMVKMLIRHFQHPVSINKVFLCNEMYEVFLVKIEDQLHRRVNGSIIHDGERFTLSIMNFVSSYSSSNKFSMTSK